LTCRLKAEEYAHDAKLKAESLGHDAKLRAEDAKAKGTSPNNSIVFGLTVAAAGTSPFGTIELYSPKYYLACTLGGIVACGLTHAAVTPLDLVPLPLSRSNNDTNDRLNVVVKLIPNCIKAISKDSAKSTAQKD
jgi:hypothetical protein